MKKSHVLAMAAAAVMMMANVSVSDANPKTKKCAACHGKTGISKAPVNPNLAGQKEKYLYNQMKAFKTGKRNNPIMKMQTKNLSDADMKEIAKFYAEQACSE